MLVDVIDQLELLDFWLDGVDQFCIYFVFCYYGGQEILVVDWMQKGCGNCCRDDCCVGMVKFFVVFFQFVIEIQCVDCYCVGESC